MRRVWLLLALLVLAPGTAEAQDAVHGVATYSVKPRPELALVVHYVGEVQGREADLTRILQGFDRVLTRETGLAMAKGYEATGAECVQAVGQVEVCLLGRLVPAFDPAQPTFADKTPDEVEAGLAALPDVPKVLVVLGVQQDGARGRWRVKALPVAKMLLAAARLQASRRAAGRPPLDALALQDELDLAGASISTSMDVDDLASEAGFAQLLAGPLAPLLTAYPALATVELTGVGLGATVRLDDQAFESGASATRLEDLPAGAHRLRVEAPGRVDWEDALTLASGEVRRVQVDLRSSLGTTGRQVTRWGGVALMAVGAGFTVAGLAVHQGVDCDGDGSQCVRGFATLPATSVEAGSDGLHQPSPRDGALMLTPFGYSLMGAGAAWTTGSFFEGEDDDIPWLSVAVGVAVGVAAYGITWALDDVQQGRDPRQ
ncbi:MAG: PEGA domain-containing protein [Deltaproteobacteria bacterium]|nr:PEGA domain-containing protein [Deltaproteobacteria bacterium]